MGNQLDDLHYSQWLTLDAYIKQCSNDFECIINTKGEIAQALPSHVHRLICESPFTFEEVNKFIPDDAIPLLWLCLHTKCCAVTNYAIFCPETMTSEQYNTVHSLIEHSFVKNNIVNCKDHLYQLGSIK